MSGVSPQFSLVLPTHNRADVLPFAICSVLAQSVGDFELFVVGDGCTDTTADVMRSFTDPRIIWLDLPKALGFGYANRNVALRQARGSLVAYLAHDDLWMEDHLELLGRELERPGVEWAYSRPLWVVPPGMIAPVVFDLRQPAVLADFLNRRRSMLPSSCVGHRRDCLEKYGYWSPTLLNQGDYDLWVRMIKGGGRGGGGNIGVVDEPTCLHFRAHWRTRADQVFKHELVWEYLHTMERVPEALRIGVPPGELEQAAAWSAMNANPKRWPEQLRDAVRIADRQIHQGWLLKKGVRRRCAWRLLQVMRWITGQAAENHHKSM